MKSKNIWAKSIYNFDTYYMLVKNTKRNELCSYKLTCGISGQEEERREEKEREIDR